MTTARKKKRVPGPIVPIGAYARLAYECLRCRAVFDSPTGPNPFCMSCRQELSKLSKPVDRTTSPAPPVKP